MLEDVFWSLDEALELIGERARQNPELAEALRTLFTRMLARLPELTLVPVQVLDEKEEPEPVKQLSLVPETANVTHVHSPTRVAQDVPDQAGERLSAAA